mmetsp:Transcript_5213/g.6812  ORF Transcript_5213/g.6812 Transcript_5213/m.6812 type:complete len:177 (-) Transcript_5213:59-589(-)
MLQQNNQVSFQKFLTQQQRLSPSLVSLLRFALALEPIATDEQQNENSSSSPSSFSLQEGMLRLCCQMQALGRFGATAFLVPLYGSGELSQAYLLRRGLDGIVLSTTDNSGSGNGNDNVVTGVRLLPSDETSTNEETTSTTTTPSKLPKQVLCKHVIVPEQVLAQPPFAPILPKNLC